MKLFSQLQSLGRVDTKNLVAIECGEARCTRARAKAVADMRRVKVLIGDVISPPRSIHMLETRTARANACDEGEEEERTEEYVGAGGCRRRGRQRPVRSTAGGGISWNTSRMVYPYCGDHGQEWDHAAWACQAREGGLEAPEDALQRRMGWPMARPGSEKRGAEGFDSLVEAAAGTIRGRRGDDGR